MKDPYASMKCLLLLAGAWAALSSSASAQDFQREKKFSKTYPVSAGTELSLENQFGNVVIHSWDKNQVKADVTILIKHGNESRARELLDNIDVAEDAVGGDIALRTVIGKAKVKGNSSMQINYEIYMPSSLNLRLVNKFGNSTLPDLEGDTDIRQSFGSLTAGALKGRENEVFIEFSQGNSKIAAARNLEGEFRFSKISLGNLSGTAGIDAEHCASFELEAAGGLQRLELEARYSDVDLTIGRDFSGRFEVSTNFGEFKYGERVRPEPVPEEAGKGPKFKFQYTGSIGDGGTPMIRVSSDFSTIDFR